MTASDDAIVTLTSSDQNKVQIAVKAAKYSQLIVTTLLHHDDEDDNDDDIQNGCCGHLEMDIPRVDGSTLQKVVEFLIYFEKNPFPKMPERLPGDTFATVRSFRYTSNEIPLFSYFFEPVMSIYY
jgi:hypothetical protein